ncbi:MAG: tetratricopeptide repeat protein [Lysobacterales bacterium]
MAIQRALLFLAGILIFFPIGAHAEDLTLCKEGWRETQVGNHLVAVELFKDCIKTGELGQAMLARTHRNIGIAYRRAKMPDAAIAAFTEAIELKPADVWDDYVNRGNAYDDRGDFERAMDEYDRALELKPGYGEAYYNRGIAYEGQDQLEKARVEFVRAYESGLRTEFLYERMVVYGLFE